MRGTPSRRTRSPHEESRGVRGNGSARVNAILRGDASQDIAVHAGAVRRRRVDRERRGALGVRVDDHLQGRPGRGQLRHRQLGQRRAPARTTSRCFDDHVDLTAIPPCIDDALGARCESAGPNPQFVILLGDGNDHAASINDHALGHGVEFYGEDGDDDLESEASSDLLDGGPGNDMLSPDDDDAGPRDVVVGGPGIDTLQTGDGDRRDRADRRVLRRRRQRRLSRRGRQLRARPRGPPGDRGLACRSTSSAPTARTWSSCAARPPTPCRASAATTSSTAPTATTSSTAAPATTRSTAAATTTRSSAAPAWTRCTARAPAPAFRLGRGQRPDRRPRRRRRAAQLRAGSGHRDRRRARPRPAGPGLPVRAGRPRRTAGDGQAGRQRQVELAEGEQEPLHRQGRPAPARRARAS